MKDQVAIFSKQIVKQESRLAAANATIERLKLEAQGWAMEARAQKATVHACYEIVTGKTGEPGDWNGADPLRKYVAGLQDTIERLSAPVSDEELEPLHEKYGYFQFHDAQGAVSLKFANALIAARAQGPK